MLLEKQLLCKSRAVRTVSKQFGVQIYSKKDYSQQENIQDCCRSSQNPKARTEEKKKSKNQKHKCCTRAHRPDRKPPVLEELFFILYFYFLSTVCIYINGWCQNLAKPVYICNLILPQMLVIVSVYQSSLTVQSNILYLLPKP